MWKHQDMKAFKHQRRRSLNSACSGKDKAHTKGRELGDCAEAGPAIREPVRQSEIVQGDLIVVG